MPIQPFQAYYIFNEEAQTICGHYRLTAITSVGRLRPFASGQLFMMMLKMTYSAIMEVLTWLTFALLGFILAVPLALLEHQYNLEDLIASHPPRPANSIRPLPLALPVRAMPLKTELAELHPDRDLLASVTRKSKPGPVWGTAAAQYDALIEKAARKHEVSPLLVKAIIQAESNFDPAAISHNGAIGLMQLMPATGRAMGVRDLRDPQKNINAGVKYLKFLLILYDDDERLAVAAYNCGPETMKKFENGIPPYRETRSFVNRVMRYYNYYLES